MKVVVADQAAKKKLARAPAWGAPDLSVVYTDRASLCEYKKIYEYISKIYKGQSISSCQKNLARAPAWGAPDLSVICTDRASLCEYTKL